MADVEQAIESRWPRSSSGATSGCTWRQLPPVFGPSWQTVYRRFAKWSRDRVRVRLHRRDERKAEHFLAFVGIAAALIGYRRLASLLTA
ncbi:transposase [Streptomyces sp. NPDC004126]|uniref:transposase n=1 Tax=Streptomyces sp. NPDC004126 TaxID=3390695 RepID=UPI003D0822C2